MAYSFVTYVGDGSNSVFSFGAIPLLDEGIVPYVTQLVVTVDGTVRPTSTYSIDSTAETVTLVEAPSSGAPVRVARVTKADDRYVDWLNSTNLNQEQLNLDSDQLLFLTQESLDGAENSIQLNSLDEWDAQGKVIASIADGVDSNDAVTVQQLNAAIYGGTPGSVQGQGYVSSTDGTASFVLPSMAQQSADDINVFVDGVRLRPGFEYSVVDNADGTSLNVTLSPAPSNGDVVEIVWVTGILAASLAEDSVDNSNVVDASLTPDKLANPGGNQFIINNPSTGPEWRDLGAADLNRNNTLASALGSVSLTALAVPNADVSMGGKKLTNLADPVGTNDAVNLETLQNELASLRSEIDTDRSFPIGSVGGVGWWRSDSQIQSGGPTYDYYSWVSLDFSSVVVGGSDDTVWGPHELDPEFVSAFESLYNQGNRWFRQITKTGDGGTQMNNEVRERFKIVTSSGGKQWHGIIDSRSGANYMTYIRIV